MILRYFYTHILTAVFLGALLTGCSDDLSFRVDTPATDDNTLTIMIPNVEGAAEYGATRADGYAQTRADEAEEGTIDHLYLLAYPITSSGTADAKRDVIFANLNNPNELKVTSSTSDTDYKHYTVSGFMKGDYRVYLVANVDKYLSSDVTINKDLSESNLKQLLLNFDTDKKIERGYIPMGCLNTEIKTTNNGNAIANGVLSFDKGTTIYADMKFLCAKVRYTILFDRNSTSGNNFSRAFSSNNVDFSEDVAVSNVVPQIRWTGEGTLSTTKFRTTATLSRVVYPTDENYFNIQSVTGSESAPADLLEAGSWASPDQRAWQGTVYLPENNVTGENATKLSFTPQGDEIKSENCNFTLSWKEPTNHGIERSKMYDLVAKLQETTNVELTASVNVLPWTPQELFYQLHGPYELIVETTEIEVSSGETTTFWYESSVAPQDVEFNYAMYGSDDMFIAEVLKDDDGNYVIDEYGHYQIAVRVNPEIDPANYENINNNISQYNYFHIKVGNLQKKIKVYPLNLSAYLKVEPQEITINVREYFESGINTATIEIKYETNLEIKNSDNASAPIFKAVITDKTSDVLSTTNSGALYLSYPSSDAILSSKTLTINKKSGKFYLNLQKLFEGDSYWTNSHSYSIEFSIDGQTEGDTAPKTVTINVVPFTTDYIIHFRSTDGTFKNPHIYVYQCLEIPADLKDGNKLYEHAGKTVGYSNIDDDKGDWNNMNAGLEYAFANNIAFRGWKGYGGNVEPLKSDTYIRNQMAVYKSYGGDMKYNYFNPGQGKTDFYNYSIDLNEEHKKFRTTDGTYKKWVCTDCQAFSSVSSYNSNGSRLFPGISMCGKDDDGWYTYILSGIATPGKALIMIYDAHEWKEPKDGGIGDERRYPYKQNNQDPAGIPLFDFPNREGWLEVDPSKHKDNSANFTSTKPGSDPGTEKPYRLYWHKDLGDKMYVWYNGTKTEPFGAWDDEKNKGTASGDYYYKDFTSSVTNKALMYRSVLKNDADRSLGNLTGWTTMDDGRGTKWINASFSTGNGKPSGAVSTPNTPTSFQTGMKIVFQCGTNTTIWSKIYIWDNNNNSNASYPGTGFTSGGTTANKTYTIDSKFNGKTSLSYILNNGTKPGEIYMAQKTDNKTLNFSDVTDWTYDNGVWTGYVTVDNYVSSSGWTKKFYQNQQLIFHGNNSSYARMHFWYGGNGDFDFQEDITKSGTNQIWNVNSKINNYYWFNYQFMYGENNFVQGDKYIHVDNVYNWRFEDNKLVGEVNP